MKANEQGEQVDRTVVVDVDAVVQGILFAILFFLVVFAVYVFNSGVRDAAPLHALMPKNQSRTEMVYAITKGPTPTCHAGTLLIMKGGSVLSAWFGGTREGLGDTGIYTAERRQGEWTTPRLAAKINPLELEGGEPHWNPVLFCASSSSDNQGCDGRDVWLFFKVGSPQKPWGCCGAWRTYYQRSSDKGATWGPAIEMLLGDVGGRGPVKNKVIKLADGGWLAPGSLEIHGPWRAFTDLSLDEGRTWNKSKDVLVESGYFLPREMGVIQPSLWEAPPGQVHMLLRSKVGSGERLPGRVMRADSVDGGRTWGPPMPLPVPNPNSGLDLVRLPVSGILVLAHNPSYFDRQTLRLSISEDNGHTWPCGYDVVHVEEDSRWPEVSYPAIVAWPLDYSAREGVSVFFTWKRVTMAYFSISLANLRRQCVRTQYNQSVS
ncbi:hypothetical protein CYMTET_10759 [Cymbomonas tetramitiformis]|uniref:Sialidase domain-containing protein n=1 Tax=Cymbomonas tetramitiformis TaxID=36881 RepID=A0AAE0GNM1_9CHLO|nr:hypothetical protein CYMTET_10759 [Cymbomonas tetramitiformis]